jgi:hypothetical protein
MNALGKALLLGMALVLQGVGWVVLWDGDMARLRKVRDVAEGRVRAGELLWFNLPGVDSGVADRAPLEFFDMVEYDYPTAFARHFDGTTTAGLGAVYREALELGREVYVREGCFHCHTQAVRAGTADVERWGRPTGPGRADVRVAGMPLAGSRRVGPDLGRLAQRYSNDWHAAHLLRPRSLYPDSIMPGYPWLFDEVEDGLEPNRDGLALIVYLQSLGMDDGR